MLAALPVLPGFGAAFYILSSHQTRAQTRRLSGQPDTPDTTMWVIIACVAALFAGAVVWLAYYSFLASQTRKIEEMRKSLAPSSVDDDSVLQAGPLRESD